MAELTLQVTGMFCAGCVHHVTDALRGVPGVELASVSLSDGLARVVYDPSRTGLPEMLDAITNAGYEATRAEVEVTVPSSLESMFSQWSLRTPIVLGLVAALAFVALYVGVVSIADSPAHLVQRLRQDLWFLIGAALILGILVSILAYLRGKTRQGQRL